MKQHYSLATLMTPDQLYLADQPYSSTQTARCVFTRRIWQPCSLTTISYNRPNKRSKTGHFIGTYDCMYCHVHGHLTWRTRPFWPLSLLITPGPTVCWLDRHATRALRTLNVVTPACIISLLWLPAVVSKIRCSKKNIGVLRASAA